MQLLFRGGKVLIYFGIVMITMGLMVFLFPKFFAYVFAGMVILLGFVFLWMGIFSKPAGSSFSGHQKDDGYTSYEEIRD